MAAEPADPGGQPPGPPTAADPGRRRHSSQKRQIHGTSVQTLPSVHDTHDTDHSPNPNASPQISAPPVRMPTARPSRKAPSAARNTLSMAATASDFQNGSTYDGRLKTREDRRLRVAHPWPAAEQVGIPQRHVGQRGAGVLELGLEQDHLVHQLAVGPQSGHPVRAAGLPRVADQRKSEADSVLPGASPGANSTSASSP